jgi:hypothetical protein
MGKIERIEVPPEDRERLVRLVRDRNLPQKNGTRHPRPSKCPSPFQPHFLLEFLIIA